jgi:hypothetical protein
MSESTLSRRLTGKAALARVVDHPSNRTFLRRNLKFILDRHEIDFLRKNTNARTSQAMLALEDRRTSWDYPSTDLLDDSIHGSKPVLTIEGLRIRGLSGKVAPPVEADRSSPTSDRDDGLPNWLPRPDAQRLLLQCRIQARIYQRNSRESPLHVDMRSGTILQCENSGGRPSFDIKLDQPFHTELSKLLIVRECGSVGESQRWRRAMSDRYSLEMTIECLDSDDAHQLLSKLDSIPTGARGHTVPSNCVLRTFWDALPECPTSGSTLPLLCTTNNTTLPLAYGIEVSMGWIHPESPLVQYNRGLVNASRARHLLTPSASDDLEKLPSKWTIRYKFRDGFQVRELTKTSLECVHCGSGIEHSSFARLYLHYTNSHQSWEYRAEGTEWMVSSGMTVVLWIQDAETPISTDSSRDRNMNWIAPSCPVDIAAYIYGEGPWINAGHNKHRSPMKRPGRAMRREISTSLALKPAMAAASARNKGKRHLPEEVKNLPLHVRKTYQVPNVPGVTFYRTTSKQAVRCGDELSESDEDIDDYWLTQRQRRDLMHLGDHAAVCKFHELFYVHINEERPSSDIHMQDAVVRFARKYLEQSRDPRWADAMRKKLLQLETGCVITGATVKYCTSLLDTAANSAQPQEWPVSAPNQASEDAQRISAQTRETGLLRPNTSRHTYSQNGTIAESPVSERSPRLDPWDPSDSDSWLGNRTRWVAGKMTSTDDDDRAKERPARNGSLLEASTSGTTFDTRVDVRVPQDRFQTCVCGKIVAGLRGTIGCSEVTCARAFHLKCLKLPKRIPYWRCEECTSNLRPMTE